METITIPYEDYKKILDGYVMSESMIMDLYYILNTGSYDRYDKDINVSSDNFRILFKKYINVNYINKIGELKQESESE